MEMLNLHALAGFRSVASLLRQVVRAIECASIQ